MIGKRIQELRIKRGLSLSELAERAGVAKSYLSAIERMIQINPSIQVLEKLSAVLEIPVQQLLVDETITEEDSIDPEWFELAKEAMQSGISKEEFKDFLEFQKWRQHKD